MRLALPSGRPALGPLSRTPVSPSRPAWWIRLESLHFVLGKLPALHRLMPGRVHQSLLWLFRRDPLLAVELAHRVADRVRPLDVLVLDRSTTLQRPGLHNDDSIVEVDLLLSVHDRNRDGSAGELIRHIWVVEVQLGRDRSRSQAWTDYLAAAAREFRVHPVNIDMLVVSPDAAVRAWIGSQIMTKMRVQPLLLEPRHVAWIEDPQIARDRPEAAVLSAVFHGHELRAHALVHAAWHALAKLEPKTSRRYRYLIRTAAHKAMQLPKATQLSKSSPSLPEPSLEPISDEVPSDWEQSGLTWAEHGARFAAEGRIEGRAEGRAEGRVEGHAEGLRTGKLQARREALLYMFELLGFSPSPAERARVESCDDLEQLDSWARQLPHCSSLASLLS